MTGDQLKSCTSCGAPMRFVRTELGESMPLDPAPHPEGAWIIQRRRVGGRQVDVATTHLPLLHPQETRYMPHWATCPNADQHRRARR